MTRAAFAAALAALHLAAASAPCPPAGPAERQLARRAHAEGALHPTHPATAETPGSAAPRELRAPCPCPCREAPAAGASLSRLGPALLAAAPSAQTPAGDDPIARPALRAAPAALEPPEPVPIAA